MLYFCTVIQLNEWRCFLIVQLYNISIMRKVLSLALMMLLTMPLLLRAEEREIPLMEVVTMSTIPGDNPLDGPDQSDPTHPCRTCFRATIDGHFLRVTKQNANIPSAQVSVVSSSNGGLVLNQVMTDSMEETISNNGVYVLHIETEGGALVGQFIVQ